MWPVLDISSQMSPSSFPDIIICWYAALFNDASDCKGRLNIWAVLKI